jgi:hypothetical protein
MWKILRGACPVAAVLLSTLLLTGVEAAAQDNYINQNISGFNLPGVSLSQGHDEVRAADGTTCRSAVGGSGAYMDVGIIGNPEQDYSGNSSMSAYGRIVVPLGKLPKRIDCSKLYDLEVQRLELELKLAQMGLSRGISPVSEDEGAADAPVEVTEAEPAPEATEAKAVAEVATEEEPAKPVKVASAKSSSSDWDDDGWSTEGLKK